MKKLVLSLSLVLIFSMFSFAQWNWYNPKPMGEMIYEIEFLNDTIGYSCGSMGHVIKTVNGGEHWYALGSIYPNHLASLSFLNPETGYAFTIDGNILKTINGGNTWSELNHNLENEQIGHGEFLNENVGVIGCISGRIYKTIDGGSVWQQVSSNTKKVHDIHFYDASLGFAVCDDGIILRTTDGGMSWTSYDTGDELYFDAVCFPTAEIGYVCGYHSFYKTVNGGDSWFEIEVVDEYNEHFFDCAFKTINHGYLVTFDGKIFVTEDGGASWMNVSPDPLPSYMTVAILDSGSVFVGTERGMIYKTSDNGDNWAVVTESITNSRLASIDFINPNEGIVVGYDGVVLKTTTAGFEWDMFNLGDQNDLKTVKYLSEEKIIITGTSGKVFISENAGDTWDEYSMISNMNPTKMEFINDTVGWVVGYDSDGAICKTTDGGYSWEAQNSNFEAYLYDVTFTNDTTGFIAAPYGTILKTTDGGSNWISKELGTENSIWYSIENVGTDTIYACGSNGSMASSFDAGQTWDIDTLMSMLSFKTMEIFDDGIGYCIALGGFVYKTSDYGASWTQVPSFSYQELIDIERTDNFQLFVVGANGAILSNRIDPRNAMLVEQSKQQLIDLYPNPVHDILNINHDIHSYKIFDLNGKIIDSGMEQNQIDVSKFPSGIYLMKYDIKGGEIVTGKFVVAH
jgi:photosystem II stability/assembly factor-like uncharacterized protein